MKNEITYLGVVRRVTGAKVLIEISDEIPSANPIIDGQIYRIGQVGSFVRIPLGFLNLYGIVSMVGAAETFLNLEAEDSRRHGGRWIEAQLVGESYGTQDFQRGVSIYPTLDDEVHIITEKDLSCIYRLEGTTNIEIGTHASSSSLPASVDLDKIITRHAAILGSTGSGKSNTVAAILKILSRGTFPNAKIIVIDPHSEYASALKDVSCVFSINSDTHPLKIPYWCLSFDELAMFFTGKRGTDDIRDLTLRDKVYQMKKEIVGELTSGPIAPEDIYPDSPIPFDIRQLWYDFDRAERITYDNSERTVEALIKEGDAKALISAEFKPHSPYNKAPYKSQVTISMMAYANKILARLKDNRFKFMLDPKPFLGYDGMDDLDKLVETWVGHKYPITVFDLGGIPFEVTDLIVGFLTRIIFELMFWGRDLPGMGRQRPILFVFEEAHAYLPRTSISQSIGGYAGNMVRRVFKEGRKYAVGSVIISQRPSELDETILSQCGTFFTLRLSNSDDQGIVKSTVPDSLTGLIELLPALRTGEALIFGEAVQIPSRIRIPLIEPRPKSDDPEPVKKWSQQPEQSPDYTKAVRAWRTQSNQ